MTELVPIDRWHDTVAGMRTITLERANDVASLLTRRDRKYVLPVEVLVDAVETLALEVAVVEVGQRVAHRYHSLYFDTERLDLYRLAATGRRRRFKVRRREYVDDGVRLLEVKTKDARGRTVKERSMAISDGDATPDHALRQTEIQFVDDTLRAAGIEPPSSLRPSVETGYLRTTLVSAAGGWRATIDRDLTGAAVGGTRVPLGRELVVETKSTGAPTPLDRALWVRGVRPIRISKFAVAMAVTRPGLPANRWHRVLRDHLDWERQQPALS